ncbi:MAG: hypothetical protein SWQ30_04705 [Thermodesulfobacteriota bacterium]|nr:hypothetical protein [Thermodesulfobacteriota bacterium]
MKRKALLLVLLIGGWTICDVVPESGANSGGVAPLEGPPADVAGGTVVRIRNPLADGVLDGTEGEDLLKWLGRLWTLDYQCEYTEEEWPQGVSRPGSMPPSGVPNSHSGPSGPGVHEERFFGPASVGPFLPDDSCAEFLHRSRPDIGGFLPEGEPSEKVEGLLSTPE